MRLGQIFGSRTAKQGGGAEKSSKRKLADNIISNAMSEKYESERENTQVQDVYRNNLEGVAVILNALEQQQGISARVENLLEFGEDKNPHVYVFIAISHRATNAKIKISVQVWASENAKEVRFLDKYSGWAVFSSEKKCACDFYDANEREKFFSRIGQELGKSKAMQSRRSRTQGIVYRKIAQIKRLGNALKPKG